MARVATRTGVLARATRVDGGTAAACTPPQRTGARDLARTATVLAGMHGRAVARAARAIPEPSAKAEATAAAPSEQEVSPPSQPECKAETRARLGGWTSRKRGRVRFSATTKTRDGTRAEALDRELAGIWGNAKDDTTAGAATGDRSNEIHRGEEMHRRGMLVQDRVLEDHGASKRHARARKAVGAFNVAGGGLADPQDPLSFDAVLDKAGELEAKDMADGTTLQYAAKWKEIKSWLRDAAHENGRPFTVDILKDPRFLSAAALDWYFDVEPTPAMVKKFFGALKKALQINGVPDTELRAFTLVRRAAKKQRSRARRKSEPFAADDIARLLAHAKWGAKSAAMPARMITMCMGLSFALMLRWDDCAYIHLHGILFTAKGLLIAITKRKQRQSGVHFYVPLPDTGPRSLAQALRAFIADLTGETPPLDGWMSSAATDKYLFRDIGHVGAPSHYGKRRDVFKSDGRFRMWASDAYRTRYREAMRHGLGLTQYAAGRFGLQSGRSGGCTHFANLGLSEDIRMWLGQWTSVRTQRGYMRTRIDQRFELVAKAEPTVGSCGGAAATGGGQR